MSTATFTKVDAPLPTGQDFKSWYEWVNVITTTDLGASVTRTDTVHVLGELREAYAGAAR